MPDTQQPQETPASKFEARRRLLKLGAYVPPAILGMMIMGQKSAWASGGHGGHGGHGGASCNPSACNPCVNRHGKKSDSYEYRRDSAECQRAQRKYHYRHRD